MRMTDKSEISFEGIQLLVLDLDGTVADTETLHLAAFNEVLKPWNISISRSDFQKVTGITEREVWKKLNDRYNVKMNAEELMPKRLEIYLQMLKEENVQPYPEILRILKEQTMDKWILSSQRRYIIEEDLCFWHLENTFSKRLCCAETGISKSEVLSNSLASFSLPADRVMLFEDSASVISRAVDFGYHTVAVELGLNQGTFRSSGYEYLIQTEQAER